MNSVDLEQGSDGWKAARAGKVTASRIKDLMAKTKTGESASRRNLRAQIVAEILTGQPQENGFTSKEMVWGTENEPFARAAYEVHNHCLVDQVGLVIHPSNPRAAASPDGLVGEDGLVEIKCPNTATHLDYLVDGGVPSEYQLQMLWQMACTSRQWCDFVSFDPRMPERFHLFVVRFNRNETRILEIEREVDAFLVEVDAVLKKLSTLPQAV